MHERNSNTGNSACRHVVALIFCVATLALPLMSYAAGEDAQLLATVESFLHSQLPQDKDDEVVITVLPSAALLPRCENPRPFLPEAARRSGGRITVGVECGSKARRVRYMQAQTSVTGNYFTVATQVPAGTLLTMDLLNVVRGDKSRLPPNTVFKADEALGRLAKHQLAPGTIVQSQQLYRRPLVHASQKVLVQTRGAGFEASREGEALESGALGDRIRVRISRQQALDAVVVGPGLLSLAR